MTTRPLRALRTPEPAAARAAGPVYPATIAGVDEATGRVEVREASGAAGPAIPAVAFAYHPAVGDRVLVADSGGERYVIGVVTREARESAATAPIALAGGGSVHVAGDEVEIKDPAGRIVVRYAGGAATIEAPAGDLLLAAPHGHVVVRAGLDVKVEGTRVSVRADEAEVAVQRAGVVARELRTTAESLLQTAERIEITATELVERTRDVFRDTSDLLQTRAGRVRSLVEGAYALFSRRTTMVSDEETSIDGSEIHLG